MTESLIQCRECGGRGEIPATPGQPGDGPMPCPSCDGTRAQPSLFASLSREGMATVWDHNGRYLGCIGVGAWRGLIEKDRYEKLPLGSELRTPEQMVWIRERFTPDGLERLARPTPGYESKGCYYLPDVAALAHAAIREAERLRDWIERHGGHPQDCAIWVELDDVSALHPVGKCDCGLAEILGHKTDRTVA